MQKFKKFLKNAYFLIKDGLNVLNTKWLKKIEVIFKD